MRLARVAALAAGGLALAALLLDWTVGAVDAMRISRQADARRVRAAMRAVEGAVGLVPEPGFDAALGRGAFRFSTGPRGERVGRGVAAPDAVALRLLVVGGGAALGWGVDDELTFARLLEAERAFDGRTVAVTNAAHLFADPVDAAALAEHWLPAIGPAVVLVCGPTLAGSPDAVLRGIGAGAGQGRAWLGRWLPSLWELDRALGGELPADAAAAPAAPTAEERRARYAAAVRAGRAAGARVVVVDLGGEPALAGWCDELDVPRVDAGFRADELRSPVFAEPRNGWPSAFGHDRIRAKVVTGLVGLGVLRAAD